MEGYPCGCCFIRFVQRFRKRFEPLSLALNTDLRTVASQHTHVTPVAALAPYLYGLPHNPNGVVNDSPSIEYIDQFPIPIVRSRLRSTNQIEAMTAINTDPNPMTRRR